MTRDNTESVFAIVLAAGASTRFGSAKQLAELDGTTIVQRASQRATECCGSRSVLVAGHAWRSVVAAGTPLSGFIVINDNHQAGMASSIAAGVRAVQHAADAVLIILADQPLITSAHLRALIAAWTSGSADIVATSFAGTTGVPALFARRCFASLQELQGDQGARALFDDPDFNFETTAFAGAAVDIDTVDDLARLARNARS